MFSLLIGLTIAFILVHVAVVSATDMTFRDAFRVSRSVAAAVLSALGFFAIAYWHQHAPSAYVLPTPDALATSLLAFPLAHFLADFFILSHAWQKHREVPRNDLLIHHGLGVIAGYLTYTYSVGAPMFLLLFSTELMPVSTGMTAIGDWLHKPLLQRVGAWLRIVVLVGWRMPLWAWLGRQTLIAMATPSSADAMAVHRLTMGFLCTIIALDLYWTYKSWRALRPKPTKADLDEVGEV
jgi:hypothetical protein